MKKLQSLLLLALGFTLSVVSLQAQGCGNGSITGPSGKPKGCDPCGGSGDPVFVYTGNQYSSIIDIEVFGGVVPLKWVRNENSRLAEYCSYGLGHYWKSDFQWMLDECYNHPLGYPQKIVYYPDGAQVIFANISGDQWVSRAGIDDELWKVGNNFELRLASGKRMLFTPNPNADAYTKFLMTKSIETNGSELQFEYNNRNLVTKVTEPAGRWLQAVYQWQTSERLALFTVAELTQIPDSGQWTELTVANPVANRYARAISADLGFGSMAEVEFYDENNVKLTGTVISSDGLAEAQKALDGNPATYFQSAGMSGGFIGYDFGAPKKVAKLRFLTRVGLEDRMVKQGFEYQPLRLQIGDFRAEWVLSVTQVQASDGRVVDYVYGDINDLNFAGGVYSVLKEVRYPDNTKAVYTYGQDFASQRPLVIEHNDPRGTLRQKRSRTIYKTDRSSGIVGVLGMVYKQINPETGGTIMELGFEGDMHRPKATFANGSMEWKEYDYLYASNTNYGVEGALITRTRDLRGNVTQYYYDGYGFVSQVIRPSGEETFTERNSFGHPTKKIEADGSYHLWTYDARQQMLTHRDELGRVTTYTRDAQSRATRIDYPDASYETFTYNAFNQVVTHRIRNGGTESFSYDSRGLLTQKTDPIGNVTHFTYNALDQIASITNARGFTTSLEYNDRGQITKMTNPDGSFKTMAYDANSNLITETNELGNTTTYAYDIFQRMIQSTDPLGRVSTWTYPLNDDQVKALTFTLPCPCGKKIVTTYDLGWNKLTETVGIVGTAEASTTSWTYNDRDLVVTVTDGLGKITAFTYDNRRRKIASVDPLGNTTQWTYDFVGNVLTTKDALNRVTTNVYDSMNRVVSTTDAMNQTTTFFYDQSSNMIKMVDAKNNAYQNTFDLLNRKTSMIYPDNSKEEYGYDSVSNNVTYITRAGETKTCTFDNRNREILCDWSDATPDTARTFDALGRLLTSNNGQALCSYAYNSANELVSETTVVSGQSRTVSYSYDFNGKRQSVTYPSGSVVSYEYTGRNQIKAIKKDGLTVATYSYDLNGNRIQKTLENGTSTEYSFDDASRLTGLTDKKGATTLLSTGYTLNAVGNRTAKLQGGASENYSFDAIDQVTGVNYNNTRNVSYNYDSVGNRMSVIDNAVTTNYLTNNLNQYTSVGGVSHGSDVNGNLVSGQGIFLYDSYNRLAQAVVGVNTVQFTYDCMNRVVKRTTNGVPMFLIYDRWSLIEERDASGTVLQKYVNGSNIDEILVKTNASGSVYYHQDGLGSVTQLTDLTGSVVEKYAYDIFGKASIFNSSLQPQVSSLQANRFQFTGREWLSEVGLYDYRNRVYSCELGRFLQTDPIRFNAGDFNLYRYVNNSVSDRNDFLGLCSSCLPYNPTPWNSPWTQPKNNCYNYALNRMDGDFKQPGNNPVVPYKPNPTKPTRTCAELMASLQADGAKAPNGDGCCPKGYHKITVWNSPDKNIDSNHDGKPDTQDFHFYRSDCGGTTSDKPGRAPAKPVSDPNSYNGYDNCGIVCVKN